MLLSVAFRIWLEHFSCRRVAKDLTVLHKSYEEKCGLSEYGNGAWIAAAAVAAVGIVFVSFLIPAWFFKHMRNERALQLQQVEDNSKSKICAERDFVKRFYYVADNVKIDAYYTESVDLLRKFCLAGLIMFCYPVRSDFPLRVLPM